jgi:hypothetical protein
MGVSLQVAVTNRCYPWKISRIERSLGFCRSAEYPVADHEAVVPLSLLSLD